jgi:hypothetical protein
MIDWIATVLGAGFGAGAGLSREIDTTNLPAKPSKSVTVQLVQGGLRLAACDTGRRPTAVGFKWTPGLCCWIHVVATESWKALRANLIYCFWSRGRAELGCVEFVALKGRQPSVSEGETSCRRKERGEFERGVTLGYLRVEVGIRDKGR